MNYFQSYVKKIGEQLRLYRINAGMTQKDLEERSGVSVRSISRLEQGASVQLDSLIRLLCALNLEENLTLLIPDQRKRPSFYLENHEKKNPRSRKKIEHDKDFQWGDEE